MTNESLPVHDLFDRLGALRLRAVEEIAAAGGTPSIEALQTLAAIQGAYAAVLGEIKAHQVKVGGGGETPLS